MYRGSVLLGEQLAQLLGPYHVRKQGTFSWFNSCLLLKCTIKPSFRPSESLLTFPISQLRGLPALIFKETVLSDSSCKLKLQKFPRAFGEAGPDKELCLQTGCRGHVFLFSLSRARVNLGASMRQIQGTGWPQSTRRL